MVNVRSFYLKFELVQLLSEPYFSSLSESRLFRMNFGVTRTIISAAWRQESRVLAACCETALAADLTWGYRSRPKLFLSASEATIARVGLTIAENSS